MDSERAAAGGGAQLYAAARKISADEISAMANLERLYAQRREFMRLDWGLLAKNYERSIFYQLDLDNTATSYASFNLPKPDALPQSAPAMTRIRNLMLRSRIDVRTGGNGAAEEDGAFAILRDEILGEISSRVAQPRLSVFADQIVWARSPVRIDLAGGGATHPLFNLRGWQCGQHGY